MKFINITRDAVVVIDDEDYERISRHRWALNPEGSGYAIRKGAKRRGEKRTVAMHQEIMHAPPGSLIDHINGNGLDNRKSNLRFADTQKNSFNKAKAKGTYTSKYKGVFQRGGENKWTARIKYNDHHVELGEYESESLAAAVYNYAAAVFFGEFRRENKGPEIPELDDTVRRNVFGRCNRACQRRGWSLSTDEYRNSYEQYA